MDSVTHIVLGAVIGEAAAGRKAGRKAMAIGSFAQFFPDFDILAATWLPPSQNLIVHRGLTHSIPVVILTGLLLALATTRIWKRDALSYYFWLKFFLLQLFIHIFLDLFNAYGVGLLEPFTHQKFSIHTIYVADPLFTVWLLFAALLLIFLRQSRLRVAFISIALSGLYLGYAVYNKSVAVDKAEVALRQQGKLYERLLVTPTPFNTWLWFVAAETEDGYFITHQSVFDQHPPVFEYFEKRKDLLENARDHESVENLITFSDGYYTVEQRSDTLVFNDLRFGQIAGWRYPREKFVFHYFLDYQAENKMVMQRGRFAKWDEQTIRIFLKRIAGN